jgi:cation diffusion facilitator CzcD-associated flavoprotein CzcO
LRYLNHVAERFDLTRDIQFNTRVTAAEFDENKNQWTLRTDNGDEIIAKWCIMATGCLSVPKIIEYPGVEDFRGAIYHTSNWPRNGVDFTGKRVGIIGTGSSGIQTITTIAPQCGHLDVFQRTPNYSVPARNAPLAPGAAIDWFANRAGNRTLARSEAFAYITNSTENLASETPADERQRTYEERWKFGGFPFFGAFADLGVDEQANDTAAHFFADKIRSIVTDPKTADLLVPKGYPIGTKRLCVDTGYYETFNRPNVSLIDLRHTPIECLTKNGIKTSDAEYDHDCIIFATGFDAMTGALCNIDIRGRNGAGLKEKWSLGPRAYLGLMVSEFPNLFTITGPGSPSVLSNMMMSIEQHVDWIAECIEYLRSHEINSIEASSAAENMWVAHVAEVANATLFPRANSWYMGANVPGKPRVFMPYVGGFPAYQQAIDDVAAKGYEGFVLV